jgi:transposase
MATHLRAELVLEALNIAFTQRRPTDVIHHSDQGCQYTSIAFGQRCREMSVRPSMGSVGDAYDNAMCESFFATLECELLGRHRFRSQAEARMAIRIHRGLVQPASSALRPRVRVPDQLREESTPELIAQAVNRPPNRGHFTAHSQRIEKVLESADVKLAAVLHPLLGVSGRAILAALAAGETDPDRLVALAHPALRAKRAALRAALAGHVRPHHRVLLQQHLRVVATLQATIAELDAAITAALAHLMTIPGVSTTAAQILVAEIGVDMSRFPSAGHLLSWAGLCPRQDASAGKRRSTRLRKDVP